MSCHYYAFFAVLVWSSAYVATSVTLASFSSGSLAFIRNFLAALVFLVVLRVRRIPAVRPADWPKMFAVGLTGLALYLLFLNRGAMTIGPTTVCVVVSTAPILTAILARFLFAERLRPAGWLGVALAFAGILVMTLWDGALEINLGVLWTFAAALSFAVYNILQRRLSGRFGTLQVTGYGFFAASVALLFLAPEAIAELRAAPADHIALVVYMGVFPSAVAYLSWARALAVAPKTSYVANYMFLTPFLALVIDFVAIDRLPDAGTLLGGAGILGGLFLFAFAGKRQEETETGDGAR